MLIQDMSSARIRAELERLGPLLLKAHLDLCTARGYTSLADIEIKKRQHAWRWSMLHAYQRELQRELDRRQYSRENWKKWWREYRKRLH